MIRAETEPSFFRRFLWIAIACVAGTGWCLMDALVTYPRKLEIATVFESYPQTEDGKQGWEAEASERDWLATPPDKSTQELEALILNQYILMAGCVVVGLIMFLKWFLPRGSWIEGDENEVRSSRGKSHQLQSLVGIDRRKWESKGIAVLHFSHDGARAKFILDDFKYNREATGKILKLAEGKLQSLIDDAKQDKDA